MADTRAVELNVMDLTGQWQVRQPGGDRSFDARVPGCIHTDLMHNGVIEDPFYRENEVDVQWVSETAWIYERTFDVPASLIERQRVLLICDGLDTFATLTLNGKRLARTDNQFRTWQFDVGPALRQGENTLSIRFDSPIAYQEARNREHPLKSPKNVPHEHEGRSYVRKSQSNYGWDWGPALPTCGIWKPLRLVAFDTARLTGVAVQQHHSRRRVELGLAVELDRLQRSDLTAHCTVSLGGKVCAQAENSGRGQTIELAAAVTDPRLWWPNGMGEQPLYDVEVELRDADGHVLDRLSRRIGLRTLHVRRRNDQWGESFEFVVNGTPFFAKGANWVPIDQFPAGASRDRYCELLSDAADAHMNMLRVWGGGIYEDDIFFDLCDELGICVWQDFMFACAAYPADEAFLAGIEAEAEDNVRRLRHHASLALWCGNNELEMFILRSGSMKEEDYKGIFDKLLPDVVRRLDPQHDYWPCSPHSPHGDRNDHSNQKWGDAHLWAVWHGRQPFEWYRTSFPRFCSEFGFQSFPEPQTVATYTEPRDRNVTSPVMEHHQRSRIGNTVIMQYMLDWFRMPTSFEDSLWVSQILQALGIKYAVEHWRRNMPRCMGALYWQLNDVWPVASWASIDSYGSWKALHHEARRFFAPVLVSAEEDPQTQKIALHVSNDTGERFKGTLTCSMLTVDGTLLDETDYPVSVGARTSKRVRVLNARKVVDAVGVRNLLVWVELKKGKQVVSRNLAALAKPKAFDLRNPAIRTTVKKTSKNRFAVRLEAKKPALYAWLSLKGENAHFSDNFLHLCPGRPVEIQLDVTHAAKLKDIRDRLDVRSLVDTYA